MPTYKGFRPGKVPKIVFVQRRCKNPHRCPLTHCGCGKAHHIHPNPLVEPQPLEVCRRDDARV